MTETTFSLARRALGRPFRRSVTRRQLAQLVDYPDRLDDLGITRREAVAEARKPFWQS